jgi:hypothetical protein
MYRVGKQYKALSPDSDQKWLPKRSSPYLLVHPNHFGTCRSRSLQVDIDFWSNQSNKSLLWISQKRPLFNQSIGTNCINPAYLNEFHLV